MLFQKAKLLNALMNAALNSSDATLGARFQKLNAELFSDVVRNQGEETAKGGQAQGERNTNLYPVQDVLAISCIYTIAFDLFAPGLSPKASPRSSAQVPQVGRRHSVR